MDLSKHLIHKLVPNSRKRVICRCLYQEVQDIHPIFSYLIRALVLCETDVYSDRSKQCRLI